jgi:hypothetical protein
MPPTTETKQVKLKEFKEQVSTCHDPYHLLAEFAYENQRLRDQITRLKSGMCSCV